MGFFGTWPPMRGEKLGLTSRFAQLDVTSFSFEGEYDSDGG
ncbi:hypothetical protein GGP95_001222 [Salinibacter ruber]|nr:hypothetical protein [Salinibacter ruber]